MKEVRDRTDGEVSLGPTSLCRSLEKLLRFGYIKQVGSETETGDSDRRIVYKLLEAGRDSAARRAGSLARSVDVARRRRLLSGEGAS